MGFHKLFGGNVGQSGGGKELERAPLPSHLTLYLFSPFQIIDILGIMTKKEPLLLQKRHKIMSQSRRKEAWI